MDFKKLSGISDIEANIGKFRPTSDDIVASIKKSKRTINKVNNKHDFAFGYLFMGIFLSIVAQVVLDQTNDFILFNITNDEVSMFMMVFSVVAWAFVKMGIWK